MPAKKKDECSCGCSCCCDIKSMTHKKGHGIAKIILGLLIIANAYYATLSWPMFIGLIVVLMGVAKLLHKCK